MTAASKQRGSGFRLPNVHAVLGTLFLFAIVGMVNYLSFRNYRRWDWTSQGYFTLSDRALKELDSLPHKVDFYLFVSEGEPNYPQVRELLERCRSRTRKFRPHYVDPDRNPGQYRKVVERFDLDDAPLNLVEVAAIVVSGKRHWTVTRDDLVGVGFEEDADGKIEVKAESAVIGALVDVTSAEPTRICVTRGHGEWSLGDGDRSLRAVTTELAQENIELKSLPSLSSIPSDCHAMFVVGPTRPFEPEAAKRLGQYLRSGGNGLFALDPIFESERLVSSGLEDLLGEIGVQVGSDVVLEVDDRALLPPPQPAGPWVAWDWGEHETVARLAAGGFPAMFALTQSVTPGKGSSGTVIVSTSESAWGEQQLDDFGPDWSPQQDESDMAGPVPLAVATIVSTPGGAEDGAEEEAAPEDRARGRVVVVGDADWLASEALRSDGLANRYLLRFVTGWLTHRRTLIALDSKSGPGRPMAISEGDLGRLQLRLLVLLPGAMIFLGFAVWWSRRK